MDRHFNYSATAQLVVDPYADNVIACNQELCRLIGENIQDVEGIAVSYLFAASFPAMIVFTDEILEFGRAWSDHLLIASREGSLRVEIMARCAVAGDETLIYMSIHRVDELDRLREVSDAQRHYLSGIGHWDQVSRVFQEFERENQLILDAAGEGIYGVDANGMTTFVNPAAERILGYSASELAGRNMHSMVHHSHADGTHFGVSECAIFAAFRDGVVHQVEDDIFWSKSGKPIDVEYTSTPIEDNGFIVGAVVIFRDVSQKKADKKQLLEALNEVQILKNKLELENAYLQEEINSEFNHHQIVGKSPAVQNILQQIELVAPTSATVLICGESGTGKELIARAIHDSSDRSHRSLIRVNCAAIPEDLFESEFFGHAKGAFTGAIADRPGRFELADEGTLFLDEVGEIPLHLQGKLLRVLQEQQFERVGEALIAIPLGFVIGMSPLMYKALNPYIQILRPISPLAWMPLALFIIKDSEQSAIFVIFICSIWPMLINTAFGVANVREDWVNVAKTHELNSIKTAFLVILPAAAPTILTGMRISIGIAWLVIVAAEMLVGGTGIGYYVWNEWNNLDLNSVIFSILMIGVVGMLLDMALASIAKLVQYEE